MVKHIVVASNSYKYAQYFNFGSLSKHSVAWTTYAVLIAVALRGPWHEEFALWFLTVDTSSKKGAVVAVAWAFILLMPFFLARSRSQNEANRVAALLSLYPLGVQLATVSIATTGTNAGKKIPSTTMPRLFLPRDQIVDCIVTEVVWAHKVLSTVVFRMSSSQYHNLDDNDDDSSPPSCATQQLISAFPGVEMTYLECLAARSQIEAFLTKCEGGVSLPHTRSTRRDF